MSVLETVLYFVVPSVGLYVLIALPILATRRSRRARYRVGQPWTFPAVWWTASPQGAELAGYDQRASTGERGGARGSW